MATRRDCDACGLDRLIPHLVSLRTRRPGGLAACWPEGRKRAARAIGEAGVLPAHPAPVRSLSQLFAITASTPVIEDVTGSGKTEAAILLADRLISGGRAAGLYFALPTMARADAMFARLGAAYRRLFAPDAPPRSC